MSRVDPLTFTGEFMNARHRSKAAFLRAPFCLGHYRTLAGMAVLYPQFLNNFIRYLTGRGEYPYACRVRTPTGDVEPTLFSSHDMLTVNEIFCRQDYAAGSSVRVVVDIGSNIGISALYFLTRNHNSRCYLYEPVSANCERLRANLANWSGRFTLEEVAVATSDGWARFGVEPTGRYGGIGAVTPHSIDVRCRELNALLEDVLRRETEIDILKIDVEGLETELVSSIRPDVLDRIGTIYYETDRPQPLHGDQFRHRFRCMTNRLSRSLQ